MPAPSRLRHMTPLLLSLAMAFGAVGAARAQAATPAEQTAPAKAKKSKTTHKAHKNSHKAKKTGSSKKVKTASAVKGSQHAKKHHTSGHTASLAAGHFA